MNDLFVLTAKIQSLLEQSVRFGPERFSTATRYYAQHSHDARLAVATTTRLLDDSQKYNRNLRTSILKLVSLECAAGASAERCKAWFDCIAKLAGCSSSGSTIPIDPVESVAFAALAGNYSRTTYATWPDELSTKQTSARVLYMMMTAKQLTIPMNPNLFDNQYWLQLYNAVELNDAVEANAALICIAEWRLSEYRDSEVPLYDPLRFPLFEPIPNAALTIAKVRDGMEIRIEDDEQIQFYVGGLL